MQKMIKVSAVIIVEGRLLLVSGHNRPFFWTPGGHIETGESLEEAVRREIAEELGVRDIGTIAPYLTYLSEHEEDGSIREVHNYLVELQGEIHASGEIDRIWWISKDDYNTSPEKIQSGVRDSLIPRLTADRLL
jgi:8-oxo-dGTP diphosphatase